MKINDTGEESDYQSLRILVKRILEKARSKIHIYRPVHFIGAIILSIISITLFSDRIELFLNAERTTGNITLIHQKNGTCDFSDGKNQPCTIFTTWIQFQTLSGNISQFKNTWEQNVKWHDQSTTLATRKVWENVKVIYNPKEYVTQAFEDTFVEIWLPVILVVISHIILFLWSFSRPKNYHT